MPTGGNSPYMYAPTRTSTAYPQSVFDPKAVSRASLLPPAPKPKQDGPLIDFNKHPDSWIIKPYAKPDVEPMNPNVKKIIIWLRKTQLGLRLCGMLLAIGTLFCVICIKGAEGNDAWIMRIPPGVDILATGYGLYHLVRSETHRTPASSASYHFFASVMDAGFIPFYVFTTLLARAQYFEKAKTEGRWTTFFPGDFKGIPATDIILHSTWLLGIVAGSVHLVAFGISSYLAYLFREITQMPPDMNPLEDNLTSRSKSKHKYKTSEVSEKHLSKASESSFSLVSPVRTTATQDSHIQSNGRPISFFNTRTESDAGYSPHNLRTANASRVDLGMYQQPPSYRTTQVDLNRQDGARSPAKSTTSYDTEVSHLKSMSSSVYSGDTAPAVPPKSSKREILSDNWFVTNGNDENTEPRYDDRVYQGVPQSKFNEDANWTTVPLNAQPSYPRFQDRNTVMQPLGMNPPTPRTSTATVAPMYRNDARGSYEPVQAASRALTSRSHNTAPSVHSSVGTPKGKYYGDLSAATQGIRGSSPSNSPAGNSTRPSPQRYGAGTSGASRRVDGQGRVVSRSGTDATSSTTYVEDTYGGNGRRDVSGKVVEEGRGGEWGGGGWRRRVSLRRHG